MKKKRLNVRIKTKYTFFPQSKLKQNGSFQYIKDLSHISPIKTSHCKTFH